MKQVPKVLIEGPKALIEDAHSPPNLSTFGKTRSTLNHFREDIQWLNRRCSMLSEGAHYHHSLIGGDYYRAAGHREQFIQALENTLLQSAVFQPGLNKGAV
jgi:hypothetical protein